jgi:hypothetical protein
MTPGAQVTVGGNPGNFVLRITGPQGLPVELMDFEIE